MALNTGSPPTNPGSLPPFSPSAVPPLIEYSLVDKLGPSLLNFTYFEPDTFFNGTGDSSNRFKIDTYMWIYISPIILFIGICGNTLTFLVMRRPRLRGTTTSIYMPAIALADMIALSSGIIPEWMEACGFPIFSQISPITCRLEKFTFYSSSDTAIWILVIFTFDRFIAVCFPLRKRLICQPTRSKMASVGAMLMAFLKNCHVFWTRGSSYNDRGILISNCDRIDPYKYFEKFVRPWVAFCFVSVLPFIYISFCNLLIIQQILKMARARIDRSGKERTMAQTTMMCLSVSFAFLICVTPSMVVHIGKPYWDTKKNYSYDVAKTISNLLSYLNHAVNFFLYCMTGAKFRRELILMLAGRYSVRMGLEEFSTTHTTYLSTGRRFTDPSIAERNPRPPRHDLTVALDNVNHQVLSTASVHVKSYQQGEV